MIPSFSTTSVIDPSVHLPGYVVFVRSGKHIADDADDNKTEDNFNSDESADLGTGIQNCVRFYAENVLVPFVKSQRQNCSYTMSTGQPDDSISNAWFDGDMNQMKIFSNPEFLEIADEFNINMNKQNAKRMTSKQGADMGDMFKKLITIQRKETL
eukprot:11075402-Ditylum_brightwellii.AAC.1